MKLLSFIPFAALLIFMVVLPFDNIMAQRTLTIENPQKKLAEKELKEGLNIVDKLPNGYKIGLVRKSGSPDKWVTVSPDQKKTIPVTESPDKEFASSRKVIWKCIYTSDRGWVCICVANCDLIY